MTATGSPGDKGNAWTMGLGPIVAKRSDPASWDPYPSPILPESCCKQRLIDIRRRQCGDGIHR